jgi:hypothetical protein
MIKNLSNPSNAWLAYVYLASNFISVLLLKYSSYFEIRLFLPSCGVPQYPQQISSWSKISQILQMPGLSPFISLAILYLYSYLNTLLIHMFVYLSHHVASQIASTSKKFQILQILQMPGLPMFILLALLYLNSYLISFPRNQGVQVNA